MTPQARAARARALAVESGFDLAGVASAEGPAELGFFAEWIARGYAGEMAYLALQRERRSDLRAAFPWARTVLSVGLQYDTPAPYSTAAEDGRGWIARYAWGDDYHDVMKERLEDLRARLATELGPMESRVYVDTGPVVERAWAAAAGLGAWGKNTCLLHPEHGSWFFLGEVITDLEMAPDAPRADMCGSCTACLEACPTGAFVAPYVLDARRCISYLTIEVKGAIPEEHRAASGRHVFGCDICQDVCPWNRRRRAQGDPRFEPREGLMAPDLDALAALDEDGFRELFRRSAVKRAKRRGLLRNVCVALGNSGEASRRPVLERLALDDDPLVREHARWGLRRLEERGGPAGGPEGPPAHPAY
ncbi:MAG TPA: tRNA epoxyqueuosine(34) reductase QueG [Vicinamibacteria bacterium]|nr:tRNA epoxyqueuosine(34) reductase QueG [Vicinamibacteria bacterium]